MSNHARRRRNTANARVDVCLGGAPGRPCLQPVEYAATLALDRCGHAPPPIRVCHLHAYAFQQHPRDPDLQACPACRELGHLELVQITRALEPSP